MNIAIEQNYQKLSDKITNEVLDIVKQKPEAVLCFPSGDTPLGLFNNLVSLQRNKKIDLSGCSFVGLDEWVGMDENDEGSCKYTLYRKLFIPCGIEKEKIHFFDAKAADLRLECERIDSIISALGGIDLMILGIGMNGHLGLNEPGTDAKLLSHVVSLDMVTRHVGQKYFHDPVRLESGITLGLGHIMQSRRVIAMVSGNHKSTIVKEVAEGEISNRVPASLLRNHPNASLCLDREAAMQILKNQ